MGDDSRIGIICNGHRKIFALKDALYVSRCELVFNKPYINFYWSNVTKYIYLGNAYSDSL